MSNIPVFDVVMDVGSPRRKPRVSAVPVTDLDNMPDVKTMYDDKKKKKPNRLPDGLVTKKTIVERDAKKKPPIIDNAKKKVQYGVLLDDRKRGVSFSSKTEAKQYLSHNLPYVGKAQIFITKEIGLDKIIGKPIKGKDAPKEMKLSDGVYFRYRAATGNRPAWMSLTPEQKLDWDKKNKKK